MPQGDADHAMRMAMVPESLKNLPSFMEMHSADMDEVEKQHRETQVRKLDEAIIRDGEKRVFDLLGMGDL
jgi:hypothetical protein